MPVTLTVTLTTYVIGHAMSPNLSPIDRPYSSSCSMVACICHLIFLSQHIIFSKNIVLCAMSATQYFFEKIMCCGKFVTTHYFLRHNTLFSKNIVLWQVCHNTLLFESQHIIFFKRYYVVRHVRNTIFF